MSKAARGRTSEDASGGAKQHKMAGCSRPSPLCMERPSTHATSQTYRPSAPGTPSMSASSVPPTSPWFVLRWQESAGRMGGVPVRTSPAAKSVGRGNGSKREWKPAVQNADRARKPELCMLLPVSSASRIRLATAHWRRPGMGRQASRSPHERAVSHLRGGRVTCCEVLRPHARGKVKGS